MQIRLTVVDPLGPTPQQRGRAARRDVLVTAPAGTALAEVAAGLAAAVAGDGGGAVVLYAGAERLDGRRCTLGEPPLTDGALLSLGAPGEPEAHPQADDAAARLHVVAGPDAGGVHLLHGGQIRIGRSADADVPLDDPDVSRLHCAITVEPGGRVSVADLGSTNGTVLDGTRVGAQAVRFPTGALLRLGESALRLTPSDAPGTRTETAPDGEGHVRLATGAAGSKATAAAAHTRMTHAPGDTDAPSEGTHQAYGPAGWGSPGEPHAVPGQGHAPRIESRGGSGRATAADGDARETHSGATGRGTGTGSLPGPRTGGGLGAAAPGRGALSDDRDTHAQGRWAPGDDSARARDRGPAGTDPRAGGHPEDRAGGAYGARGRGPAGRGRGPVGEDGDTRAQRRRTTGGDGQPYDRQAAADNTDPRARDRHPATGTPTDPAPHHRNAPHGEPGQHGDPGPHRDPGPGPHNTRTPADADPRTRARGFTGAPTDPAVQGNAGRDQSTSPRPHRTPADDDLGQPARLPAPDADIPHAARKRGGLSAWARKLAGGKGAHPQPHEAYGAGAAAGTGAGDAVRPQQPETWPDPAALLLTALGPGPRLWERGAGHPEALTVRLGTADRTAPNGLGLLPAVPVTTALREAGALGLAGPRPRLSGLARSVLAQLTALHSPDVLEVVLISTDRARPVEERTAEWSWLGWLPHLRPANGQDCRLLLAYDREQAAARTDELLRRLDDRMARDTQGTRTGAFPVPYSVLVVDGDPGGADVRDAVERLALEGPAAGIHVLCLAETAPAAPASPVPVTETYDAACAVSPAFRACGAVSLLGGDVATALHLMRVAHGAPVGSGTVAAVDAVSPAWAERFARALAPLRTDGAQGEPHARVSAPLPPSARLLDELGLARATPASLMARWADAADDSDSPGGRARAVLGAGPRGPLTADLVADGPHLLIEGPPGSGRTELVRAVVASLAAAERPDRLGIVLVDGRDGTGASGSAGGAHGSSGSSGSSGGPGDGLRVCTEVPHTTTYLTANDPVRMREFAQSLSAELKRRAELLGRTGFAEWHTRHELSGRVVPQHTPGGRTGAGRTGAGSAAAAGGDLESPPSTTLRLRPSSAARQAEAAPPLPRLVVVVDDLDALVSPALGSPGRPAAGSVLRALDAVAREGARLGVHLVAATGPGGRTADTEPARRATLRVTLDAPPAHHAATGSRGQEPGGEPAPGRGRLAHADGRVTAFQGGRVTGRIPRTATQRPTVVPLEWQRMGDPPTRRHVRELGNGPTDLALLASALERAARSVAAAEVPSLL
ncbi:FHA domain-containing protein [Streptomyces sp. YIM S03343]